jgi:hypothetical protein
MSDSYDRLEILQQIEDGAISAGEGLRRLEALAGSGEDPIRPEAGAAAAAAGTAHHANQKAPGDPAVQYWRRWWLIPLSVGIVLTVLSALMMYWAVQSAGVGFWFLCSWIPLSLGLAVTALAAGVGRARWVHVRVDTGQKSWLRRIAISLPIPLGLAAWLARAFGRRVPAARQTALDDLLAAMDDTLTSDGPIYIEVNESEKGERVQVFVG